MSGGIGMRIPSSGSGPEAVDGGRADASADIIFDPPIPIEIDDAAEREARLAALIADRVVPRLLAIHEDIIGMPIIAITGRRETEIAELARIVIGPDNTDAQNYIQALRQNGLSLDKLHIELLEPTARHLGELWVQDSIDFFDVTIGVGRLQRLVHVFAELDLVQHYDEKRRALILVAPGEHHSFGNAMVQRFLRAGGWHVCTLATFDLDDVADIVAREWFGVVGFSLSADIHLENLAETISAVRTRSLNRTIGVMVGGPAFASHPDRVASVGADGTAANAPAAVILAKKLLAASLLRK